MRYISIIAASTLILCNLKAAYAVSTPTSDDIETITERRVANIINDYSPTASQASSW
jgi:hypothetical protein